jgi:hypothetical protein
MRMLPDLDVSRHLLEGCWRNLRTESDSGSIFILMKSRRVSIAEYQCIQLNKFI